MTLWQHHLPGSSTIGHIKQKGSPYFMATDYLHQLTHLRLNTNCNQWSDATAHRAPHKPFLLLSILDLAAQGQIDSPFIEPSFDLIERFARYWDLVRPPSGKCNMAYPFYHMQSEGFWRLVPKPGQEQGLGERTTYYMTWLQKVWSWEQCKN